MIGVIYRRKFKLQFQVKKILAHLFFLKERTIYEVNCVIPVAREVLFFPGGELSRSKIKWEISPRAQWTWQPLQIWRKKDKQEHLPPQKKK